jgi:hypothetical protein
MLKFWLHFILITLNPKCPLIRFFGVLSFEVLVIYDVSTTRKWFYRVKWSQILSKNDFLSTKFDFYSLSKDFVVKKGEREIATFSSVLIPVYPVYQYS